MSRRKSEIFENLKILNFKNYYDLWISRKLHSRSHGVPILIKLTELYSKNLLTGSNHAKDSHCWNKSYEEGRRPSAMTLSQFEELKKTVGKDPTAPENLIAASYDGDEFMSLQK